MVECKAWRLKPTTLRKVTLFHGCTKSHNPSHLLHLLIMRIFIDAFASHKYFLSKILVFLMLTHEYNIKSLFMLCKQTGQFQFLNEKDKTSC